MPKPLPGRYKIKTLSVYNDAGMYVDLMPDYTQINFFESILAPTITGYVVVTETSNYISGPTNALPIMGNEIILIELELPKYYIKNQIGDWVEGPPNIVRYIGRVIDIKTRELINDRSSNYEIHFASEEMVLDRNLRLSKSYSGLPLSSIASNIFSNFKSLCKTEFEKTLYMYNIIIPNWTPLKAINWLASRSISAIYNSGPMFFFQSLYADDIILDGEESRDYSSLQDYRSGTSSKYWYVSLDYLLDWTPRKTLFFGAANIDSGKGDAITKYMKFSNVLNYEIINSFNTLENNYSGMFNSRLVTHDITTKQWNQIDYNYDLKFKSYNHVDPGKHYHGVTDILNNNFTSLSYNKSLLMMAPTGTPESPNHMDRLSSERASRLQSLNNFKLNLLVHGDGLIEPGDIINFQLPSPEALAETKNTDQYYAGNYLVTAIRHIFNKEEYKISIECSKEALKREV